jgi:hypothetical protein
MYSRNKSTTPQMSMAGMTLVRYSAQSVCQSPGKHDGAVDGCERVLPWGYEQFQEGIEGAVGPDRYDLLLLGASAVMTD